MNRPLLFLAPASSPIIFSNYTYINPNIMNTVQTEELVKSHALISHELSSSIAPVAPGFLLAVFVALVGMVICADLVGRMLVNVFFVLGVGLGATVCFGAPVIFDAALLAGMTEAAVAALATAVQSPSKEGTASGPLPMGTRLVPQLAP